MKRIVLSIVLAVSIGAGSSQSSILGGQPAAGAGSVNIRSPQTARLPASAVLVGKVIDKYNRGNAPQFVDLTPDQRQRALVALDAAYKAGFRQEELITVVSIAGRESNWNPGSHNNNARTRDNSYGLWQINMLGRSGPKWKVMFGIDQYDDLLDPYVNARAAMVMCKAMISYGKTCFHGWGPYKGNPPLGVAAKYVKAVHDLAESHDYLTPGGPAEPDRVLQLGMSGDDVKKVQKQLNAVDDRVCGDSAKCKRKYRVIADGEFGEETEQAVIMFQRDQGLNCDGVVGPATRAKLITPSGGWKGCKD